MLGGTVGGDAGQLRRVPRLDRWERDGALVLEDEASGTGVLAVGPGSTLFGGGAAVSVVSFVAGAGARLENAGRIDLTDAGALPGDTFRVAGDYVGNAGLLLLDTTLGGDGAPSTGW